MVLLLGMKFENGHQYKEAVWEWAIWNGHNLKIIRSSRYQLEMRCMKNCPWKLYVSMFPDVCTFCIKTLVSEHLCPRVLENRMVTGNWIEKQYRNKFRRCPNFSPKELAGDLLETFCVRVSRAMLYRSESLALEMLMGSIIEHYGFLRSYKAEMMRVDREGRFDFMLEEGGTFKAFYIGFSSLKKGFMKGCRKIIRFDGCSLKTFLGGALLTAVAKDGNNQMFPICWVVVESENEFLCTWFLEILFEELGIIDGCLGLTNAIMKLTPHAEHRNCVRHVYCNWKKEFKGQTLKNLFWSAARSTYEASYNAAIEKLLEEDEAAHKDFLKRGPNKLCKFYMSEYPKSDMIDNNVCECFNGYIVKTRGSISLESLSKLGVL
ncbi:uncharacterized protein LOC126687725 [Mercurialis annua]|uniref:uncharacterized protein LOC126687725 n=1 Tax=Mercurialis annua TaxID=3986 RepID=UPI002160DC9A|nr:uncharacterized protein LOC126687725 [Mercurialis annua]